ncbi:hypothetical protein NUM3379_14220 [Kineococcus sp. NUM-3379]
MTVLGPRCRRLVAALPLVALAAAGVVTAPVAAQATAPEREWIAVTHDGAGTAATAAAARTAGADVVAELASLGQVVVRATDAEAARLRAGGTVRSLTPDAAVHMSSGWYESYYDTGSPYNTAESTGAVDMWEAGYTGNGIDIALIDTGVTPVQNGPRLVIGPDLSFDSQDPRARRIDRFGHGTHLAGVIAGDDGSSVRYTNSQTDKGIAPDARVVSLKVGDVNGGVDVSQVIAAIDWCVQHRNDNLNLRVINLAFGTDSRQAWTLDPLAYAAEVAVRKGIVVVASTGNTGGTVMDNPAYSPWVIAVGATDPRGTIAEYDDVVASYSTRGNGTRNPDLVAPGTGLVGLRSPGSVLDAAVPNPTGSRWMRGTGTSQAAAVVSGAVALLLQQRPNLTPAQVKAILRNSATSISGATAAAQGAGRLNLARARYAATPYATNPSSGGTGTGTLEASRGSQVLILDGVPLTGEKDVFGAAFSTSRLASAASTASAWNGGTFNGRTWAGTTWWTQDPVPGAEMTYATAVLPNAALWSGLSMTSWSGRSWSGRSWSGKSWSGRSWSGRSWSGSAFGGAVFEPAGGATGPTCAVPLVSGPGGSC